jgi:hypothetical protein
VVELGAEGKKRGVNCNNETKEMDGAPEKTEDKITKYL